MIYNQYFTPIFNRTPLTESHHLKAVSEILTASQLESLDNGNIVKLTPKQEILMSIKIFQW